MATTTVPVSPLNDFRTVSDAALQAAVRPLRRDHLRAVVDAARCVAQNSSLPGASALAQRVLAAVRSIHGDAALRS